MAMDPYEVHNAEPTESEVQRIARLRSAFGVRKTTDEGDKYSRHSGNSGEHSGFGNRDYDEDDRTYMDGEYGEGGNVDYHRLRRTDANQWALLHPPLSRSSMWSIIPDPDEPKEDIPTQLDYDEDVPIKKEEEEVEEEIIAPAPRAKISFQLPKKLSK
ncbi:uncharacterized protein LY89DRAFT_689588 [Mollisia scopiformis]|uniref:Uncharacterized protein n=1 Tax=Mollisia scopiformis TaxID=149040 RepID=A0A132BEM8_MOLSC|nr:uncharacterized protein LY89DRAFT_689588 [Mollisia scopiformis]KUJ10304.1 hypothetical protein LY89DRAFT_689588 [Mollisia scopiformis]